MERSLKRKLSCGDGESSSENASNNISQPNSTSKPKIMDVTNNPKDPVERLRIYNYQPNLSETSREEFQIMLDASVHVCRFLLKTGLPYRCHDDSAHSICEGLFLETLKLIEKYDEALHEVMLEEAPGNDQTVYPRIQKEIVNCFAKEILKSIFDEIGTDVFALSVDKFSDVSNEEQMAVVLRYVDARGLVKERFVGCVHLMQSSGSTLKSVLDTFFAEKRVSLKQLRGQSYYGASDICDEFHFLRSLILKDNSSAYYGNCFAHQLQLVVVAVAKKHDGVEEFFYMLDMMMNVVCTSCLQKDTIQECNKDKVQKAMGKGESETCRGLNQDLSLIQVEDTRWDFHHQTIISLISLFSEVVKVLEYVEEEGDNGSSRLQASDVLSYFETLDFVFCLHLMLHMLGLTSVLSRVLQRKDQSILETVSLVKGTKRSLQKFKENGFGPLLEKIDSFCQEHNLKMLNMDEAYVASRNRKTNITNQHYFEVGVFNKVLDMQIQEFGDRFNEANIELLDNMSALSPRASFSMFDASKLMRLSKLYPYDFNHTDRHYLEFELELYYDTICQDEKFANLNGITDLARLMVETEKHLSYPCFYRLLKLVLVLPFATATVERSFSRIKLVKSELCNRMGDDYLNDSLICAVEREALANVTDEAVLARFQNMKEHNEQL